MMKGTGMETAAGVVGAIAVIVVVLVAWGWAPWRPYLRRRVVVVLRTETTITGILWQKRGPIVVLRDAHMHLVPGEPPKPMDGEVVVERDKIEWMQVVTTGA